MQASSFGWLLDLILLPLAGPLLLAVLGLMLLVRKRRSASVLLLGITTHMTQDVAAIPFLWVIPLAVYLVTFILCFETAKAYRRWLFVPAMAVALYYFARLLDREDGWSLTVPENVAFSAALLFVCCMVCHGELAHPLLSDDVRGWRARRSVLRADRSAAVRLGL